MGEGGAQPRRPSAAEEDGSPLASPAGRGGLRPAVLLLGQSGEGAGAGCCGAGGRRGARRMPGPEGPQGRPPEAAAGGEAAETVRRTVCPAGRTGPLHKFMLFYLPRVKVLRARRISSSTARLSSIGAMTAAASVWP